MLGYLKATLELFLTLGDKGNGLLWWVDASNGVHMDLKGHTGGTLSLGKRSIMSKSTKQKINTSSSIEAELVGAFECMIEILWTNFTQNGTFPLFGAFTAD